MGPDLAGSSGLQGRAGFCEPLWQKYPLAWQLCTLLSGRGETKQTIDTGLLGRVYSPPDDSKYPNGDVEPQEVYHRSVEIIEQEVFNLGTPLKTLMPAARGKFMILPQALHRTVQGQASPAKIHEFSPGGGNIRRFLEVPLADISPEDEKRLFAYDAWRVGFRLPWVPYDGDPMTRDDVDARLRIRGVIDGARGAAPGEDFVRALVEQEKVLLPTYVDAESPEMNVLVAMREGRGDCTENSMLLYAMLRMEGLDSGFSYVSTDMDGDDVWHLTVWVETNGERLLVDPVPPYNAFPAPHEVTETLPLLTVLQLHYRNKYLDEKMKDPSAVYLSIPEISFDTFLSIDPTSRLLFCR